MVVEGFITMIDDISSVKRSRAAAAAVLFPIILHSAMFMVLVALR